MARTRATGRVATLVAAVAALACAGAIALHWWRVGFDLVEAVWELSFLAYAVLGALLVRRRPDNRVGWLLLVPGLLVSLAALVDAYALRASIAGWPGEVWARWLQNLLWVPALALVIVEIPLRFPTGEVPGPRWRWVSISTWVVVAATTIGSAFAPGSIGEDLPIENPLGIDALGGLLEAMADMGGVLVLLALAAFASLVVRRRESPREHLQLRWFVFSLVVGLALVVVGLLGWSDGPVGALAPVGVAIGIAAPAVGIAIAVLRHRLYGIDAIISRSAACAIVSLGAGIASLLVAAGLGALVGRSTTVVMVLTTVLVALGVHVSWRFVQQRVDRAVFGARGDPYRVVRLLGERLELAGSVDDAVTVAAATLASALRLPSVAVRTVDAPEGGVVVGRALGRTVVVPIVAQGTRVGDLEIGLRRGEDALSEPDQELIAALARSLGPLCQAAALTGELRRSLDRLGRIRAEERDRIHRDLHDGIGPTLAGLALRVDILRSRSGPEMADELAELEVELRASFQSVAAIVDGLRPQLLDERGLVAGLVQHCAAVAATTAPPLEVDLRTDGDLVDLPTTVEGAAWYITAEALNNVVRHSGASRCEVHVSTSDHVEIVVSDDGVGPGRADRGDRTGLRSMRARAQALGGRCTIAPNASGGTTLHAVIPIEAT